MFRWRIQIWQLAIAAIVAMGALCPEKSRTAFGETFATISDAEAAALGGATGGSEIRKIDNGNGTLDLIHLFKSSGTLVVPSKSTIIGEASVLVVGGGASGSGNCGGGGGAGGLIYKDDLTLSAGTATVTVGAGGVQPAAASAVGLAGGNSVLTIGSTTLTAFGGGIGGIYQNIAGQAGGSGGGGSGSGAAGAATQPTSASGGYGNKGGAGTGNNKAGGGGGAGSAGKAASGNNGGAGGDGLMFDISGEEVVYAAGGGGASQESYAGGAGGSGGVGGRGAPNKTTNGDAGQPNTGSGGGGGNGGGGATSKGGAGGSGIVIVRYTIDNPTKSIEKDGVVIRSTWATTNWVDGDLLLTYADPDRVGELVLPNRTKAWVLAVGGGGAGANPANAPITAGGAGGGGAGGFVENENKALVAGSYVIQVGAGGLSPSVQGAGANGEDSTITSGGTVVIQAVGGGGGGMAGFNSGKGSSGGSGGGGSKSATGGAGTPGQGNAGGGCAAVNRAGGGGGGAGGAGEQATTLNIGGAGGAGKESLITGNPVIYAAGGGGGSRTGTGGAGGSGIGGTGGGATDPTAGLDGTGSGGGGGKQNTPGGRGGSGIVIVRIRLVMPDKPAAYTEATWSPEGTTVAGTEGPLERGHYTLTVSKDGGAAVATDAAWAKDAGTYVFTATLAEGLTWGDGTTAPYSFSLKINKAALSVVSFTQNGWQIGELQPAPVLIVRDAGGNEFQLMEGVRYFWQKSGSGSWTELTSATMPTTTGAYTLRAEIAETPDFNPPAEMPTTTFTLWTGAAGPLDGLGYHAVIAVSGYTGTELNDFPMLVRVRENQPEGFHYNQAFRDGSDIRFTDPDGNLLAHEIDTWNPNGESLIWVKVPRYDNGDVAVMCWGPLADAEIPAKPSSEVWTDYVGVWHLNEASGTAANSSPFGADYDARVVGTATDGYPDGVLGGARTTGTAAARGYLSVPNYNAAGVGSVFTVSGWVRMDEITGYPRLFSRKNGHTAANGWELEMQQNSFTAFSCRGASATAYTGNFPTFNNSWVWVTIVYNDTTSRTYGNGVQIGSGTITAATDNGLNLAIGSDPGGGDGYWVRGQYDEVRLCKRALTAEWIKADYDQMCGGTTVTWGPAIQTPDCTFQNHWLVDPVVPVTEWGTGLEPTLFLGVPVYGTSYFEIRSVGGEAWTNSFPTKAGSYDLIFRADAGTVRPSGTWSWAALATAPIEVNVTAHTPVNDLSGTAGSATLSGRILLANNDTLAAAPITDQDYSYTENTRPVHWVHDGGLPPNNEFANVRQGTVHYLMSSAPVAELNNAMTIWKLTDVYLGTTYTPTYDTDRYNIEFNYLPWSETSAASIDQASYLMLRNVTTAVVESPCYTNGVGTIYFDAVNGWTGGAENGGYKLVLEAVTGVMATSMAEIPESQWEPVPMIPLFRDMAAGEGFVQQEPTTELSLMVTAGHGTIGTFYRVIAPVECHEPVKFRIRRTSVPTAVTGEALYALDDGGFIFLDNLVVSYPSMRADLSSFGWYDPTKSGKQTLGYENAWNVPFPSVNDDLYPRAQVTFYTNPGKVDADTNIFITAANLHYRWRYLDQKVNPWTTVALDPGTLTAPHKMELGDRLPGDIEFFFDLKLNAPFYQYVDYAQIPGFRMGDFHSEETGAVTNRAPAGSLFMSQGSDWFVRLRGGQSDFESVQLALRTPSRADADEEEEAAVPVTHIPFELVGDHIWRGYLKTPSETVSLYRIEFLNEQEPGSTEWVTNTTVFATPDVESIPVSTILDAGTDATWARLPVDAKTGYLLFQIDDRTKSIMVVRADYMNFNNWTDARKDVFVGSSIEDAGKSGVSPKARDYSETFNSWLDMPATNVNWEESFVLGSTTLDDQPYETFASAKSPQGWDVGQGQWVYGFYKDNRTTFANDTKKEYGYALQMEGQGRGYITFDNVAPMPRGIQSISFNAYLAQSIDFNDFSYYCGDGYSSLSNYTFTARTAFDLNKVNNFRGNASLSLVAYYRQGIGAYEFRVEPRLRNNSKDSFGWNYNDNNGITFSLYKWHRDSDGQLVADCLGSVTGGNFGFQPTEGVNLKSTENKYKFWPMYLSVTNDANGVACIQAGVMRGGVGPAYSLDTNTSYGGTFFNIRYRDTGAKFGAPLKRGSYGVLSANCEGVFLKPYRFTQPLSLGTFAENDKISTQNINNLAITFSGTANACRSELAVDPDDSFWYVAPGRMTTFVGELGGVSDQQLYGLKYVVPKQSITIYTKGRGTNEKWTALPGATKVAIGANGKPFGSTDALQTFSYNLYTNKNCSVKIAVDGKVTDVRRDVVIDDIKITQWSGADWDDEDVKASLGNAWMDEANMRGHTNFVFQSGWIKNGGVLLSAKRTAPEQICAIRSPLFDDSYGRGVGLGMISYSYKNADPHTRLYVQIATNINYNSVNTINDLMTYNDGVTWITVATNDFSTATDRTAGTRSCYIGLHGVEGVMRLVMDPAVVRAAAASSDPTYGEILIDSVYCRDEPNLDSTAWWGWNLRTVGADAEGRDAEKFLYLPDSAQGDPSQLGLSLALNNSVSDRTDPNDPATYKQHLPFVQTPTFGTNIVGEVSFRARKYDTLNPQPAQVTVFGSRTGAESGAWTRLTATGPNTENGAFIISNDTYTAYSFKTPQGEGDYAAFRLVVTGVEGVSGAEMGNREPEGGYATPVRVLLDEVVVSEAVRARIGFRNVGAIRGYPPSSLNDVKMVPNMPNPNEQPLCGEGWGVQCEIFAAQLPDEIDFTREPRVRLHWFKGLAPWGFDNWRTNSLARSALLHRATDATNLVYRSTYYLNDGASVVPAVMKSASLNDNVFQFMLEVEFYQVGQPDPVKQLMPLSDWKKPSWYDPVDFNKDFSKEGAYAAYNILDTVSPKWAWINEVNIFGAYDLSWNNTDANNQYIEFAVPAEADITGWYVNFISPKETTGAVVTNLVAMFGQDGLSGTKANNEGMISNKVFRLLASPNTKISHPDGFDLPPCAQYAGTKATIDGVWSVRQSTDDLQLSGEVSAIYPIGIQLVRASGIVEHEVVAMGTNLWNDATLSESLRRDHDPTNVVNFLNRTMSGAHFLYLGEDAVSTETSLSVVDGRGETTNVWDAARVLTPGRLNEGQSIDPNHPTANGESMIIFCNLDQAGGPIFQTVADAVNTNGSQVVFIQKGHGTNITYRVGEWHELGSASANGAALEAVRAPGASAGGFAPYTWTVRVGGPTVSNNVTVTASAKVRGDIDAQVEDKRYLPAIVDWLTRRTNLYGVEFGGDDDELRPVDYVLLGDYAAYCAGTLTETNKLSLLEMYWLDLDPTAGTQTFVAGTTGIAAHNVPAAEGNPAHTNVKLDVFMMITNRATDTACAPYAIRDVEPGRSSWDFVNDTVTTWTSATFKVTGVLLNGKTDEANGSPNHLPVRWFVFTKDSFTPDFTTNIEVDDPTTPASPGYWEGWKDAASTFGWGWAIDQRRQPIPVEKLKPENNLE